MRSRPALLMAAVSSLLLVIPPFIVLSQRVANRTDEPLSVTTASWAIKDVELPGHTSSSPGRPYTVYRAALMTDDTNWLVRHSEIRLLTGTYGSRPELEDAQIRVVDTPCVFTAKGLNTIPNNDMLVFQRGSSCAPTEGIRPGNIALMIRLARPARIAMWVQSVPATANGRRGLALREEEPVPGMVNLPIGRAGNILATTNWRRADLLAYVWQVGAGTRWLWIVLTAAAVLHFLGTAGFWLNRGAGKGGVQALSGGAIALALGAMYAVTTPPFQAPDEPHHFTAFLNTAGRGDAGAVATRWGSLTHFVRLRFRTMERFAPSDVGRPGEAWADAAEPDSTARGGAARAWWAVVGRFSRTWPVPMMFLSLRLANALLFAMAFGVATYTVSKAGVHPEAPPATWVLFLVPTLPFFSMHVSNYAVLVPAELFIATGILLLFLEDDRDALAGGLIGAGWACACAISRSAAGLGGIVLLMVAGRAVLGRNAGSNAKPWFWLAFAAPVTLALILLDPRYLTAQAELISRLLPGISGAAHAFAASPWVAGVAILTIGIGLESVMRRLRLRFDLDRIAGPVAGLTAAAAGVMVVMVIASAWMVYPSLIRLRWDSLPAPGTYAMSAIAAVLTMPRLRGPDFLTSMTFWGGFGWLDTYPSEWLVNLLAGGTGLALTALLARTAWLKQTRRSSWLLLLLVGTVGSVAIYAVSSVIASRISATSVEVQGRYLLGLYLCLLLIVWLPVSESRAARRVGWIAPGLTAAIHGYCLAVIVARYF